MNLRFISLAAAFAVSLNKAYAENPCPGGIRMIAKDIKLNYVPAGEPEDGWNPNRGGSIADLYTFNGAVKERGVGDIGFLRGVCTKIHLCEPNLFHCEMTLNFDGMGEMGMVDKLMIMGDAPQDTGCDMAVVGGVWPMNENVQGSVAIAWGEDKGDYTFDWKMCLKTF
eukprot:CAMPEP_0185723792 /NCGR_PEP_ID=MMETSP1171-20130828/508_1 /TAXON_ID=374046 /ORGANISM="Helicotheca tamensis, Strain CCMP826" /LENGTH=167 /DNA_ID=CAMNT_0028391545 /DNA_START=122 /DNA_END=625 /DNA_ORIENTATION=+